MAILMHGDAAFAGQGLVYETLAMSQLIGYRTGGTIHLIVNNQIGFTTVPAHAYSGLYCTDMAKSIQAPILHVNGDDPEAVMFCARMAAEYRMRFASDIVLDIVCYRRHGHNETDEPAFTQPVMYKAINATRPPARCTPKSWRPRARFRPPRRKAMLDEFTKTLEDANSAAKSYKPNKADWLEGHWAGFTPVDQQEVELTEEPTAIPTETLKQIGAALAQVPDDFNLNPKIARQLEAKQQAIDSGEGIDWATGEALAFGSLLLEGSRIRLSGEDTQRGTFSQRHAVLIDQTNQHEYTPLNNIAPDQAKIEIYNSLLSEAGVLGFEYGYSLADPRTLVLWEAQFGDFANGAQVIIDQFLASGETKWLRMSGLVLLLPHGYEGQGPEHSSARIERYLQLCAERNMYVCNLTTPANYFHALRRQLHRNFRKPLIVFEPKSLLRHKLAVSPLADMADGTPVPVRDPGDRRDRAAGGGPPRGDLLGQGLLRPAAGAAGKDIKDIAIIRLEQMYPFPDNTLGRVLAPYRQCRRGLVPGGAREHGCLELRRPPHRESAEPPGHEGPPAGLCRARGGGQPGDRPRQDPHGPAGAAGGHGARHRLDRRPRFCTHVPLTDAWRHIAVATEIVVPALGESVTTATVARWMKQQGDTVAADEPLVELETDKVTVEVNAPSAGVLSSIGVPEGTEVEVGAVLGLVDGGAAAAAEPAAG